MISIIFSPIGQDECFSSCERFAGVVTRCCAPYSDGFVCVVVFSRVEIRCVALVGSRGFGPRPRQSNFTQPNCFDWEHPR